MDSLSAAIKLRSLLKSHECIVEHLSTIGMYSMQRKLVPAPPPEKNKPVSPIVVIL